MIGAVVEIQAVATAGIGYVLHLVESVERSTQRGVGDQPACVLHSGHRMGLRSVAIDPDPRFGANVAVGRIAEVHGVAASNGHIRKPVQVVVAEGFGLGDHARAGGEYLPCIEIKAPTFEIYSFHFLIFVNVHTNRPQGQNHTLRRSGAGLLTHVL